MFRPNHLPDPTPDQTPPPLDTPPPMPEAGLVPHENQSQLDVTAVQDTAPISAEEQPCEGLDTQYESTDESTIQEAPGSTFSGLEVSSTPPEPYIPASPALDLSRGDAVGSSTRFAEPDANLDLNASVDTSAGFAALQPAAPECAALAKTDDRTDDRPRPSPRRAPATPEVSAPVQPEVVPPPDNVLGDERDPDPSAERIHQAAVAAQEGKSVNIGDKPRQLREAALSQVDHEVRQYVAGGQKANFFVVDFNGPVEESFLGDRKGAEKVQLVQANILDEDGFIRSLTAKQLAGVVAETASTEGDQSTHNAVLKALNTYNETLGQMPNNANKDPLSRLRAAVHTARKEHPKNESREEKKTSIAIGHALTESVGDELKPQIGEVGNLLDAMAVEADSSEGERLKEPEKPNALVTVFNSGVTGDTVTARTQQRALLEHGLIPALSRGAVHRLVVDGVAHMTPAGRAALEDHCRRKGIKYTFLVDPNALNQDNRDLVASGLRIIGAIENIDAARIISDALPTRERSVVESANDGITVSEGGSNNRSLTKNSEPGSDYASGIARAGSEDRNESVQRNTVIGRKIGQMAVGLPHELLSTETNQLKIIGSTGTKAAVVDLSTGNVISAFPPPEENESNVVAPINVQQGVIEDAANIRGRVSSLAMPAGHTRKGIEELDSNSNGGARPSAAERPQNREIKVADLPRDEAIRPASSTQFVNRLRMEYSRVNGGAGTRKTFGGDTREFVAWCESQGWDITASKK